MTELTVGKPEITFGLHRNEFVWKSLELAVNAERITEEGTAELYFYHYNGTSRKLLHMGKANLLSSTMPREFIKSLSTRGMENIDWQNVLTYIQRDTMEHLREGEPVTWLSSEYGQKRPEYLLPPLFVKNAANIIYADKSSVKSLFMTLVDIALSLPWHNNNIGLNVSKNDKNICLFLDWENDAEITGWQKECIIRGMGIGWCDIPYLHCSRPLVDSIEHIRTKVTEVKANVIIVDSLGMAVGDDLNLTKPAFNFYSALRQLPVTPLIIAHTAKDAMNRRRSVYGNAYYENEARSVWEVSKQQSPGANDLVITLHHRKSPPFAGYHEPLAWRFVFEEDRIMIETTEPEGDKREQSDIPSASDVILGILSGGIKIKPDDIIKEAGMPRNNIYQALFRLKSSGRVNQDKDGYSIK